MGATSCSHFVHLARGKDATMSTQQNKAIVRRFFEEVINQGDFLVADELFSPDFGPAGSDHHQLRGPDRARRTANLFRTAFPDIHFEIDDMIGEDDVVVVRVTFEGTHQGAFLGIEPTGRRVRVSGVELARLENQKIVEEGWHYYGELQLLKQLGALPPGLHGQE
jgi:predicted ester cyclase